MTLLHAIQENTNQLSDAITRMARVFDSVKTDTMQDPVKFEKMMAVGVSLKKLLSTPVLNENGEAVPHLQKTISGYLEY